MVPNLTSSPTVVVISRWSLSMVRGRGMWCVSPSSRVMGRWRRAMTMPVVVFLDILLFAFLVLLVLLQLLHQNGVVNDRFQCGLLLLFDGKERIFPNLGLNVPFWIGIGVRQGESFICIGGCLGEYNWVRKRADLQEALCAYRFVSRLVS